MLRIVARRFAVLLLLNTGMISKEQFGTYRKVEAYEVRPGILMMPKYMPDGQICEIGLQRLLYSPELIRLDSDLPREEINQILDELVPADERGTRTKTFPDDLVTEQGASMVTTMDFENVTVQIYGKLIPSGHKSATTLNEVVAAIKWKKRNCQ